MSFCKNSISSVWNLSRRCLKQIPFVFQFYFKRISIETHRFISTTTITAKSSTINIAVLSAGLFSTVLNKNEEISQDYLYSTLLKAVVHMHHKEFKKAEELLKSALRIGQDLNNQEGITFVYDCMASLAMEQEDFPKAVELLSDVLKRLYEEGYTDDSPHVLYISSKMAHALQLQGKYNRAEGNYQNIINRIENKLSEENNIELRELLAQNKTKYGQLHVQMEDFKKAKECFLEAYDAYINLHGQASSDVIEVLYYLSLSSKYLNNSKKAVEYMEEAVNLAETIKDESHIALMKAQLGLLYLQLNMLDKAKESCVKAINLGKKYDDYSGFIKAEECLGKIKKLSS